MQIVKKKWGVKGEWDLEGRRGGELTTGVHAISLAGNLLIRPLAWICFGKQFTSHEKPIMILDSPFLLLYLYHLKRFCQTPKTFTTNRQRAFDHTPSDYNFLSSKILINGR